MIKYNKMSIIYGIIELNTKTVYGENNEKRFYPHNKNLPIYYVPTKKPFNINNYYCGIKFDKIKNNKYYGKIEKYIGELGILEIELEYLKYIAINNWSSNSKFKYDKYINDLTPNRINLLYLNSYSIDPNGCKDIDDALSIENIDNNKIKLYIHIADVSSYIEPETDLDLEIRKRKESVYLQKIQVNMIPDKLSINNISLIEGKESRALTLEIIINNNNIESYKFYKSIINVKNISYNTCQELIDNNKNSDLINLYNIGKILYEKKFSNINNYNTHYMVEIFMIISNVCVAKDIKNYKGAIFRKQDKNYEKMSQKILIDFNPAIYTNINNNSLIHNTLNEDIYTHFTSPMRRYIDIINHRIISNIYCGTNFIVDYDTNNEKFIEELNIEHKKIKKINLLSQLYVNIFDINFKECDIYNGIIIGFNNNKLKVYIKDFGIINIVLFNKQFNNLYEYIIEDDKYILYNKETNNKTIYSLNQQICVKIGITKLSRKKINATLFL